jgi:hypothetical protein
VVIETLSFRLVAGADEAAFLDADRYVQTELVPNHPGFLRRTTARSSDGEWLVVVLWRTAADAAASMSMSEVHAPHTAFMALVDPATVRRKQYTTLD